MHSCRCKCVLFITKEIEDSYLVVIALTMTGLSMRLNCCFITAIRQLYSQMQNNRIKKHTHTHAQAGTHARTRTNTHTRTRTHRHTHTHTHTHTRTHARTHKLHLNPHHTTDAWLYSRFLGHA